MDTTDNMNTTRDFTVAVFVVRQGQVLLHRHRKLGMWLPPGGHIEENELPDEAAVREVREEAGLRVELVGDRRQDISDPPQLVTPAGIQLEEISPGHEHIDLIYFARPLEDAPLCGESPDDGTGWYGPADWEPMGLTLEVRGWCERALQTLQ